MKNGLVIADSGPIFSLALIDKLEILNDLFDNVRIPVAVWTEITIDKSKSDYQKLYNFFNDKTCQITELNELAFIYLLKQKNNGNQCANSHFAG